MSLSALSLADFIAFCVAACLAAADCRSALKMRLSMYTGSSASSTRLDVGLELVERLHGRRRGSSTPSTTSSGSRRTTSGVCVTMLTKRL